MLANTFTFRSFCIFDARETEWLQLSGNFFWGSRPLQTYFCQSETFHPAEGKLLTLLYIL